MRRIQKQPIPAILDSHGQAWTDAYVRAVPEERPQYEKWRHPDIKKSLSEELGGRCAYCEGLLEDVSYPHVEHIRPKSTFPELAHDWANLTSACARCNTEKRDYFHERWSILNPYEDHISDYLQFMGDLVDWKLGAKRGEITVKKLKLNRIDLVRARFKRLAAVKEMLERWHSAEQPIRDVLAEAIRLDVADGEFVQSVTTFLKANGFPV